MKKFTRFLSGVLSIVALLSATACGNSASDKSSGSAATASYSAEKPLTLRYANQHPIDHVAYASAEAIKAEVEEKTGGRVLIDIYPASTLGDFEQMYEEVIRGTIDIAHISGSDRFDPRCNASLIPYITYTYDGLEDTFGPDSYVHQQLTEAYNKLGVTFMGVYCEGFCGVGIGKQLKNANVSNADKDALIRCVGFSAVKASAERLGFRTSTIPYSDTFTAIQTGVVEGWIGGPPNLNYLTFRDVIKYYYQYSFFHEATQMMVSNKAFEKLTAEDQEILREAMSKQCVASYTNCKEEDDKYRDLLRDEGIEVIMFSDDELKAIAEDIRDNAWPKVEDFFGKEFMDGLRADIAAREGT